MPAHDPLPAGVFTPLLRPRLERERLVDEVCDRLSHGLDSDVATLRDLMTERDARRRSASRSPSRHDHH